MDKLNKLSLPATILLASLILGGFIYITQLSKQRSIEKQQQLEIETKKQEQEAKELKEQQVKEEEEKEKTEIKKKLDSCIMSAETSYSNQWYRECKSQGKLSNRCISLHDMTYEEYKKENNISEDDAVLGMIDFMQEKDECSCRLPLDNADRISKELENSKTECFKKYPQI